MAGRTLAWFHCFAGIAGDMALGSLVDAGADLDEVRTLVGRLPVGGWELEAEAVLRAGVAATQVHVRTNETAVVRTYAHISGLVVEARLPERVRDRAQAVFAAMAEVEGRLHRRPPEQVHFHELGGLDAIVDVVGTCAALEVLGVDGVRARADATGEALAHAVATLLEAGAHDAWITPILMKKGRPAYTVSALADQALADQVGRVLVAETGSLGVRGQTLARWPAARSGQEVEVEGLPVRVKVSAGRVKVEHDDAARAARRSGLPLREVVSRAEAAWRRMQETGPRGIDDDAG